MLTTDRMPSADSGDEKGTGVYEIRIAPSDADIMFMSFLGYVFVTTDAGETWTRTSFSETDMDPNDSRRYFGEKMAIDPAEPDHVLVGVASYSGSTGGFWRTTDGGSNWTKVTAVGNPSVGSAVTAITFDPNSGTDGNGRTNDIYACIGGDGFWNSTDAGASWNDLSASGPSDSAHGAIAGDGIFYCTGDSNSENAVWKYDSGWSNITPGVSEPWHAMFTDLNDNARIVTSAQSGRLIQSLDRGSIWGTRTSYPPVREAEDIPWLEWTNEDYMSTGKIMFDPNVTDRVIFSEGIGVWWAIYPDSGVPSPWTWTSQSVGIEQLVSNEIICPTAKRPVIGSWDRSFFISENQDVFPSRHYPTDDFSHCPSLAVDPQDADHFVAAAGYGGVQQNGYTTNGGTSWNVFGSTPAAWGNPQGGCISVNGDNLVWIAGAQAPYYSTDNGQNWSAVSFPGVSDYGDMYFLWYIRRRIFAADPLDGDTFYAVYINGSEPTGGESGVFKTVNGGVSWTRQATTNFGGTGLSIWNGQLNAVPGRAGHLTWTNGHVGGAEPSGNLYRSTDGGQTWGTFPDVLEARAFAYGMHSAAGAGYPALCFVGWYNSEFGIWQSDDPDQSIPTWMNIGDYPMGWFDMIVAMSGDPVEYGRWYVGFSGSGAAYYRSS